MNYSLHRPHISKNRIVLMDVSRNPSAEIIKSSSLPGAAGTTHLSYVRQFIIIELWFSH